MNAADLLTTQVIELNGRSVTFASGGRGLPVLFIHGWGLDQRAYQNSLKRLIQRGCHVTAPSLPGFGGTRRFVGGSADLSDYADWVAGLLAALGPKRPHVVLGHSFGGAIAARFALRHPEWASSLVLVNSAGDPQAFKSMALQRTARPFHQVNIEDAISMLCPSSEAAESARLTSSVFVENLARDPLGVARAARLAMTADVRDDVEQLSNEDTPVTVIWSDRDTVIPYSAFDTFCQAVGADGHVASGGHSWLLTEPDAFGSVLSNLLAVEGARHRTATTGATADDLVAILARTSLPKRTVKKLLADLSHLWLLSAPSEVLAADLAMCHPKLKKDEVRVAFRPLDGGVGQRVSVVAADRPGLLADTTAVLASEGCLVEAASVQTWVESGLALHSVSVFPPATTSARPGPFGIWPIPVATSGSAATAAEGAAEAPDELWHRIGQRLRDAASNPPEIVSVEGTTLEVNVAGSTEGTTIVRVNGPDQPGLLAAICRWFSDHDVWVESAGVETIGSAACDVFVVSGDFEPDALIEAMSGAGQRRDIGGALRSALMPWPLGDIAAAS